MEVPTEEESVVWADWQGLERVEDLFDLGMTAPVGDRALFSTTCSRSSIHLQAQKSLGVQDSYLAFNTLFANVVPIMVHPSSFRLPPTPIIFVLVW